MGKIATLLNKRIHPLVVAIPVLFVLMATTTAFVYTEGDDAAIVAYHSQGRNGELQAPFSLYSFGYDVLLSVLPADESVLRIAVYVLNWISVALLLYSILRILARVIGHEVEVGFQLIVLLAWPFLFMHGCTVLPNVTAMALIMGAHYLLISQQRQNVPVVLVSGVLAGIAMAIRWDVAPYMLALVLYPKARLQVLNVVALFGASMAVFLIMMSVAGYSVAAVIETVVQMRQYFVDARESVYAQVADMMAMMTPAFTVLLVIGAVSLARSKDYRVIVLAVLMMFFSVYMNSGLLYVKYSLLALPYLLIAAYRGYSVLRQRNNIRFNSAFVAVAVIPWLIGVHVVASNTNWGPGYEVNQIQYEYSADGVLPDDRMKISAVYPVFSAGFAVPTKDGVRPLYGYLHLMLGQYRNFSLTREKEREAVVDAAINSLENVLVAENKTGYLVTVLNRRGYYMRNPDHDIIRYQQYTEYRFHHSEGKEAYMIVPVSSSAFSSEQFLSRLGSRAVPFYARYTERYRSIQKILGVRLTTVSPFTGYINVTTAHGS